MKTNFKKITYSGILILFTLCIFIGCQNTQKDPEPVKTEELIATIERILG